MKNSSNSRKSKRGFTLIEILLVVALIAILASIVIVAINPTKQLSDTRNAQRRADVNTILSATSQYEVDTGSLPAAITTTPTDVCASGGDCTGLIDLGDLDSSQTYVVSIPKDPTASTVDDTGYRISKSSNGRITVSAPHAENGATISISR